MDESRKQFEEWAISEEGDLDVTKIRNERLDIEAYRSTKTFDAWRGWQAARSLTERSEEREVAVVVARYKAGNTALLEALMDMVLQHCTRDSATDEERVDHGFISANEDAIEILEKAGMLIGGKLQWDALVARKVKRKTWAEAVNECVTDPSRRAEFLALDGAPPLASSPSGKPGGEG